MKYSDMFEFDDKLIKISEYNVLGRLPDPFMMDDGSRVATKEDWEARRKEIYRTAVELQYGTQPPQPEYFDIECCYTGERTASYRIYAGTKEKHVEFMMHISFPKDHAKNPPVVVDGDLCFNYHFTNDYVDTFIDNGIAFVKFNRTELAHDIKHEGKQGPLYRVYPEYTFGALSAWAWGYSRCVDALEKIGGFDLNCIAFTGHSRGGKTAMLAGVLDERCTIVNPNETNAGSCSCYRIHSKTIVENGTERESETLKALWGNFDFWIGPEMEKYTEKEEELPFDCHFLKALVAPRVLLIGEAASDSWTNQVGSWQTSEAAKEVYKFLGCEENLLWYYRKGFHYHHVADVEMLVDVIKHVHDGEELKGRYFATPFEKPEKIYDWKAPEKK